MLFDYYKGRKLSLSIFSDRNSDISMQGVYLYLWQFGGSVFIHDLNMSTNSCLTTFENARLM